jgi:hypothetical protein
MEPRSAAGYAEPTDGSGRCPGCRVTATGIGLDPDYRLTRLLYVDSEFNIFPGTAERGAAEERLLGVKVGHTARSWGVFTQLRPGFVHYERTLVPGSSSEYGGATRFAFVLTIWEPFRFRWWR